MLSQFLMAGLATNAHTDQLIAFWTALGFASEFQFGAGTKNHANSFKIPATVSRSTMSVKTVNPNNPDLTSALPNGDPNLRKPNTKVAENEKSGSRNGLGSLSFDNRRCKRDRNM